MSWHPQVESLEAPLADLAPEVAEHVLACTACRSGRERALMAHAALLALPLVAPPPSAWDDLVTRMDQPAESAPSPGWRVRAVAAGLFLALLAVGALVATRLPSLLGEGWAVAALEGAPRIDSRRVGEDAALHPGDWLVTDASSRARVDVGAIGNVIVGPGSRVRLVATPGGLVAALGEDSTHRLELVRGRIDAQILAPPRLFIVDTPEATAIDLGCAYSLIIDEGGSGRLEVSAGRVSLERDGREVVVPQGAACAIHRGVGPGTPHAIDASAALLATLDAIDTATGLALPAGLDALIALARSQDALTLVELLPRTARTDRGRLLDALVALVPLPAGVTREGTVALDERMLVRWRHAVQP